MDTNLILILNLIVSAVHVAVFTILGIFQIVIPLLLQLKNKS